MSLFSWPQPASLGPCYVPLGLKESHLCALTSHREASKPPPQAFSFSSLSFLPPKPKSCRSAEVDVARKLLRWALTHLIATRDRQGRWGSCYYLHRCGRGSTSLSLHRGSWIGAIHGWNRRFIWVWMDFDRVMQQGWSIKPKSWPQISPLLYVSLSCYCVLTQGQRLKAELMRWRLFNMSQYFLSYSVNS